MTTKIPVELSSTPGIVDGSNATAITIDSSEQVTLASNIHLLGSVDQRIQLSTSGSGSSPNTGDNNCHVRGNDDILILNCAGNGNIKFQENGTEKVNIGLTTYNASDRLVATNTSGNASMTIVGSTSGESSIFMADGTSGDASYRGYVQYQHTNDNMNFGTAGAERMRIASGGGVAIGTTSPDGVSNLTVKSQNATAGQEFVSLHHQASSGLIYFVSFMTGSGSDVGYITFNGTTGAFTAASDISLKENIRDLTGGLDFINQIKPRVFDWKEEGRGKDQVGFIAQEIETIKPEWVGEKEGYKNIPTDLPGTVPYLIKAIQEQQTQIETQQTTINDLKSRIETLEG